MNQIVRRIFAGVSAVILSVSAVTPDAFKNMFVKTVSAEDVVQRKGRSTGFPDLEQDTDNDGNYYNTGYGLHTNKTATALEDGRTFDVNLESWYVGENPVDVATILDASGSMAWTVDTLDPMKVSEQLTEDEKTTLKSKYETDNLTEIQDKNGGYLPQDVVDLILDKTKTDNSKLSYADYQYYVYEERSSVSEFVPLGYWDGGEPTGIIEPIGYYPFEGTLKNEVNGGEAKLIKHAEDTEGTFDETQTPMVKVDPVFTSGGDDLQLDKTAEKGALLADVKATGSFTVSMRVKTTYTSSEKNVNKTPLIYIGSATGSMISLYRGGDSEDPRRLRVAVNGSNVINIANLFQSNAVNNDWLNISLSYDANTGNVSVDLSKSNNPSSTSEGGMHFEYNDSLLNFANADIIIGGDVVTKNYDKPYADTQLTTFCVFSKALTEDEIKTLNQDKNISNYNTMKSIEGLTAYYDFDGGSLKNEVGEGNSLTFIEQAESGAFSGKTLEGAPAEPVYTDMKYQGDHSLNLTQTAKNGGVLLDAVPDKNNFTISFAVTNSKASETTDTIKHEAELVYMGSLDTSKGYYNIFRSQKYSGYIKENQSGDPKHIRFSQNSDYYGKKASGSNAFNTGNWTIVTFTVDGNNVTAYVNGAAVETAGGSTVSLDDLTGDDFAIILGGLVDEYDGKDILIDDLYIFDKAFDATQVKKIYEMASDATSPTKDCGQYHATTKIDEKNVDIAQIKEGLYHNPYDTQREGWYYVNSHSTWADIEGCLESGKQYVGICTEKGFKDNTFPQMADDTATVPSEYDNAENDVYTSIKDGDTGERKYVPPTTERSIRFYVDTQNHLRCFVWSGGDTKEKDDLRTFCSVVYEKQDKQPTKYEALNGALNDFYKDLAGYSDLSNTAIVRFSTDSAVIKDDKDTTNENLKKLIMQNWTDYSDKYSDSGNTLKREEYLQDLLIPAKGETSVPTAGDEYPYVMTGGTYTWTGLKSFYDNMVKTESDKTGKVYDIANDARDKYLIIFTDGRDNTQDLTQNDDGTNDYDNSSNYKKTDFVNYSPYTTAEKHKVGYGKNEHEIQYNGDLAEAWADKLKEEGYTIYCVMLATGSISPSANEVEYNRAYNFMKTLAGANEGSESNLTEAADDIVNKYIRIVNNDSSALSSAFAEILKQIQQPRDDYVVQDYIDPRFDLIDNEKGLLKLSAGGVITDSAGKILETVGNFIDDPDAIGYTYTPITTEKVTGTGTIYYDDVKDMYYLRWENQTIPMASEAFNTDDSSDSPKYLDVWSATIRLKAKDDFIGGNNILTNGNEAGENLVYSDATIKNMDKGTNYTLYGFNKEDLDSETEKIPYRKKLEILSGTNRKINAVDADGVSQAVYGDGIDIPSSGFPRTTVDVKLLMLNANNLNDVIYMGEVISPTMMLADLENDYMTDSYYLEYLERYAYRIYGESAGGMPLIELLNKWLKIDDKTVASKTFTIPYIYLPDPEYKDDKLVMDSSGKVKIQNSTGWDSDLRGETNFADLNLCDITGFITYTWKRGDGSTEEQQKIYVDVEGKPIYDITKEYVVKDTNQINYNLQLKFTPLKEGDLPEDFKLDDNFIQTEGTGEGAEAGDSFFNIVDSEFHDEGVEAWTIEKDKNSNRANYLKAMVKEQHTYTPYVNYNEGKWEIWTGDKKTDEDTYDWNSKYKKVAGNEQLENDLTKYTSTPNNVCFYDAGGNPITDETGAIISDKSEDDICSLAANTTYIKDVVNGALVLELVVDGKYLQSGSKINPTGETKKTYTFEATRYYDDPIDPLPYGDNDKMNADTRATDTSGKVDGKKYQLTFEVDKNTLPKEPQANQFYTVWATLTNVEVEDETDPDKYVSIKGVTEGNKYTGYAVENALPIGTYEISTDTIKNKLSNEQFKIADSSTTEATNKFFEYLKIDNVPANYTYDKFPENVYNVSADAIKDTKDGEYLILNGATDNSPKNIADSNRTKSSDTQTATFYFGTVKDTNTKGTAKEYVKDRLGIIILSADNNSLAISKMVTYTDKEENLKREWEFTITFKPDSAADNMSDFSTKNETGFNLTWYTLKDGKWKLDESSTHTTSSPIKFTGSDGVYTATLNLKHNEKVLISGLQEGKWQVEEKDEVDKTGDTDGLFYSAHNNMDDVDEYRFSNKTSENELNPNSYVDFVNEFPRPLPSTGGNGGIDITLYCDIMLVVAAGLYLTILFCKKCRKRHEREG